MSEGRTLDPPTDGELLYRLSRGDEPAYRWLHDRHQMPVFRLALVLMPTSRDAEEVAATAFFELWRKRDKVRVIDGSVLPWLLATTSFTAKNSSRSRQRYQRLLRGVPHDDHVPDHADEVARAMDSMDITEEVRRELLRLSPRDASLLVLCVIHELPVAQAAVVLGVPERTVRSRLARVRARRRGELQEYSPTAEEATA